MRGLPGLGLSDASLREHQLKATAIARHSMAQLRHEMTGDPGLDAKTAWLGSATLSLKLSCLGIGSDAAEEISYRENSDKAHHCANSDAPARLPNGVFHNDSRLFRIFRDRRCCPSAMAIIY
ncbi:hypothetical protein [Rhizobium sp. PAMB 3182]